MNANREMTLTSSQDSFLFRKRNRVFRALLQRPYRLLAAMATSVWILMPLSQPARAFDRLELALGALSGVGWRAEQVRFTLDWGDPETAYVLEIARLQVPALKRDLKAVKIDCSRGVIETQRIACEAGRVRLPDPLLDEATMSMSFELDRASGRLSGKLKGIAVAGGTLDMQLQFDTDRWDAQIRGRGLHARSLKRHWPSLERLLEGWSLAGKLDLEARLSGRGETLHSGRWQGRLSGLSLGDPDGAYAGEGIALDVDGRLAAITKGWRVDSRLSLNNGELLTPLCYLDAGAHPLEMNARMVLDSSFDSLALEDLTLNQPGLLDLQLQAELSPSSERVLQRLELRVAPLPAGDLYREMLQPVLAGSPWGRFEMSGEIDLAVDLQADDLSLELGLNGFSLDDLPSEAVEKRLGLYDLKGRLFWRESGPVGVSHLSWRAGHLLERIDIGAGGIEFETSGKGLKLTRQARLPILDGALVIDRLDLRDLGSEAQRLQFDGFIEPISMSSLSQALGWLPLSGKLSGMLPGLRYEQGLLSVDGVLLVRIFDGDILIKNLKTRDLFGVYPQLSADIELHKLDLESLTHTFSFGRITGRLDGYVRELRMEDWSPVAFDARFFTPEGDDSRHRISQKAVDNISNLGGAGMSGALARSFMRFFEEFGYKRIGIGCRLSNGVCDMVGAGPAKQGYYLVEGSGIPRIDIIGFNTTADWSSLVEQLKQIAASEGPVVE
ncbi:MAG: hypothetical protein P8103_00565 [Candidatus Thiodiazotropha sp.]